jgi:hypothetical protein
MAFHPVMSENLVKGLTLFFSGGAQPALAGRVQDVAEVRGMEGKNDGRAFAGW